MQVSRSARISYHEAFLEGIKKYFKLYGNDSEKKSTSSYRMLRCILDEFPFKADSEMDWKGSDFSILKDESALLSLVWSNTYLTSREKERIKRIDKELSPRLNLGLSLMSSKDYFLVYRFENGYIEYSHISKSDYTETPLKRVDVESETKEPTLFSLKGKRKRKANTQDPHPQREEAPSEHSSDE